MRALDNEKVSQVCDRFNHKKNQTENLIFIQVLEYQYQKNYLHDSLCLYIFI